MTTESQVLSLLTGEEILAEKLVLADDQGSYRAATYDLRVGDVFPADSVQAIDKTKPYVLPPGGMVRVVSRETIKLPIERTAHVLLKNELCRKCVLAINIGVIDPLFDGPISSTLINFGKKPIVISPNQNFLRVSFHRCSKSSFAKVTQYQREQYLRNVELEVSAYAGETFLNVEATTKAAAAAVLESNKNWLIYGTPLAAIVLTLVLAIATIFIPLGASYVDRYITGHSQSEVQRQGELEKKIDAKYEKRLQELSEQIIVLQRERGLSTDQNGHKKGM